MINSTTEAVQSNKATIVEGLPSNLDPLSALKRLSHLPFPVFLDSSLSHPLLGKASYVLADPFEYEVVPKANQLHFARMDQVRQVYHSETIDGLPGFQGGLVDLCSYGLNSSLENIPRTINEFDIPDLYFGLYDTVLIFDHQSGQNWIVSHGYPALDIDKRTQRAQSRIQQFKSLLKESDQNFHTAGCRQSPGPAPEALTESNITNLKESSISHRIYSNFTQAQYIDAVRKCIEYIYDGDIFQVNLSQRLLSRQQESSLNIYEKLRQQNQATFSAYLDLGQTQILSSSPERLLSVGSDGTVETRPIKGTRQRSCYPEANLFSAEGLITSEKDRAENVMIVDLLRNDLSKLCNDDSIHVTKLCGIENYEYVQHLVSVVRGQLSQPASFSHILESIFPGGSITGAPKVRAMEIIAEIEQVARGAYCGSLGYFGFDGAVDQNILIRTITAAKGWLQIPVGGGIVSQSDPVSEYEETVHKAHGMLRSIMN